MITISVCVIARDEEDVIARCLTAAQKFADEIIFVDTGSKDRTREIAGQYTDNLYDFPWIDDFSAARNFAFSKAAMQYTMWMDADDTITQPELDKLLALKESLEPDTNVVMMQYLMGFDENDKPSLRYYRERLIRTGAGLRWEGAVHESITPTGKVIYSDVAFEHRKLHPSDPDRNLRIFEKMVSEGARFGPREQFYYARELIDHGRHREAAILLRTFLDSGLGWVENCIEACRQLAVCHYQSGDAQGALRALLRSLEYDEPRAELCCDIGRHFYERGKYRQAVFWYTIAATRQPDNESGGFILAECYGYLPCIQLCLCCDRLGEYEKAAQWNERAAAYKPADPSVQYNREYFKRRGITITVP